MAFREAEGRLAEWLALGMPGDSVSTSDLLAAYAARASFPAALRAGRADAALAEIADLVACTGGGWGCMDASCPVHGIAAWDAAHPAPPRVCEGFSAEGFPCRFSAGHAGPCGGVSGDDLENS